MPSYGPSSLSTDDHVEGDLARVAEEQADLDDLARCGREVLDHRRHLVVVHSERHPAHGRKQHGRVEVDLRALALGGLEHIASGVRILRGVGAEGEHHDRAEEHAGALAIGHEHQIAHRHVADRGDRALARLVLGVGGGAGAGAAPRQRERRGGEQCRGSPAAAGDGRRGQGRHQISSGARAGGTDGRTPHRRSASRRRRRSLPIARPAVEPPRPVDKHRPAPLSSPPIGL